LLPAESSIHTSRIFAITISGRVVYEDTSKMKILGVECCGIVMPDTIQP